MIARDIVASHPTEFDAHLHVPYYPGDPIALFRAITRKILDPKPRDEDTKPINLIQWASRRKFFMKYGDTEEMRSLARRLPEDATATSALRLLNVRD
jgi:hypothetical protein